MKKGTVGSMYYFYDATYILVLIGVLISAWASFNVSLTFKRYSKTLNTRGITGREAAQRILFGADIKDVRIERVRGNLTDHYSPGDRVLRLSESVYDSSSVAAIGVAAHECGHAIQHHRGYLPLKLRSVVIPLANIGSTLSWPVILLGLFFGWTGLIKLGIILFAMVVFFQLVTLPVEFNASRRALKILKSEQMLEGRELKASKKVLTAAALTYVAALLTSILQLLRLVLLSRRRR